MKASRLLTLVLFILLSGLYVFCKFRFHELWKDEWQVWMMARDMGWGTLLGNLYFEGHPALWYLYIKPWTYLHEIFPAWPQENWLQLAHTAAALAAFGLLFFRLRFPLFLKVLLFGSYFFFFEYGIVNRGYIFVLLLGFLAVPLLPEWRKRATTLAVLLFLLCQVEVYSVLMAGALTFFVLLEAWQSNGLRKMRADDSLRRVLAGAGLGLLAFLLTVFPRSSERNLNAAFVEPFSAEALTTAWQGNLVNTYWLGAVPDTNAFGVTPLGLILSTVILGLLIWFFHRDRVLLLTFGFFTTAFFLFSVSFYTGGVRQWGMLFVFFIFCLHLWYDRHGRLTTVQWLILGSFLLFQGRYTLLAVQKEVRYPFTNAAAAGRFIREKVPPDVPVIAINKFAATPVIGYAGRNFYALPEGEPFSYFKWTEKIYLPPEAELDLFAQYKKVRGLVVLSYQPLSKERYPSLQLWESFDRYNIKNENYWVYLFESRPQQ